MLLKSQRQKGGSLNPVIDTTDRIHPKMRKEFAFDLMNDDNEGSFSWFFAFNVQN